MTTNTLAPTSTAPGSSDVTTARLTFIGLLRSELIKLRSVRSTVWCYALVLGITIVFALLITLWVTSQSGGDLFGSGAQGTALLVSTLGVSFSQLVVCVLGVLVISGEYGTGMIRSTFTAVPRRLPALFAKVTVFGAVTFLVSIIGILIAAVLTAPLLSGADLAPDLFASDLIVPLVGAAAYLTLVGIMSLALGAIVRNSAGGIAAALGLILVVPTIVQTVAAITQSVIVGNILTFLPSSAGASLYQTGIEGSVADNGLITLDATQGGLVLIGWVVLFLAIASLLLKRRDV